MSAPDPDQRPRWRLSLLHLWLLVAAIGLIALVWTDRIYDLERRRAAVEVRANEIREALSGREEARAEIIDAVGAVSEPPPTDPGSATRVRAVLGDWLALEELLARIQDGAPSFTRDVEAFRFRTAAILSDEQIPPEDIVVPPNLGAGEVGPFDLSSDWIARDEARLFEIETAWSEWKNPLIREIQREFHGLWQFRGPLAFPWWAVRAFPPAERDAILARWIARLEAEPTTRPDELALVHLEAGQPSEAHTLLVTASERLEAKAPPAAHARLILWLAVARGAATGEPIRSEALDLVIGEAPRSRAGATASLLALATDPTAVDAAELHRRIEGGLSRATAASAAHPDTLLLLEAIERLRPIALRAAAPGAIPAGATTGGPSLYHVRPDLAARLDEPAPAFGRPRN